MAPTWMIAVNAATLDPSTCSPKSLRDDQNGRYSTREELGGPWVGEPVLPTRNPCQFGPRNDFTRACVTWCRCSNLPITALSRAPPIEDQPIASSALHLWPPSIEHDRRRTPYKNDTAYVVYTPCITGTSPGLADRQVDPVRLSAVVTMSIHRLRAGSGYDWVCPINGVSGSFMISLPSSASGRRR